MITPPTKSFFAIQIKGEAADLVMRKLSPQTMADVHEAILISDDFEEDIEATNTMDETVARLRTALGDELTIETIHNPLYIPSTQDQIDSVLEGDPSTENFKFTGMDGSPFTMKSVVISRYEEEVVTAKVACHQFELPSYVEILEHQSARPQ